MNAIELLKSDHDKVEKLFEKVKETEESEHPQIFTEIKRELDVHTHIEETIFYPKMMEEGDEELKDIVKEGIEEHRQAKMFLQELAGLSGDNEGFKPKLKVLMEDIEHHVKEEEDEMFKLVEQQFDAPTLEKLGQEMETEKKKAMKSKTAGTGN